MDVRFGDAIEPRKFSHWWELKLIDEVFLRIFALDELFQLKSFSKRWIESLVAIFLARETRRLRDACMREIYGGVTVNLSHLTSQLILQYLDAGQTEVAPELFNRALYLAIKNIQDEPSVYLHRSLRNPEAYRDVEQGKPRNLEEFWLALESIGLVERDADQYRFLPKLRVEHGFDEVRLSNPVQVYANEIAPLGSAIRAVAQAVEAAPKVDDQVLAQLRFDDEVKAYDWCRETFSQPRHEKKSTGDRYRKWRALPAACQARQQGWCGSGARIPRFAGRVEGVRAEARSRWLSGHGRALGWPWNLTMGLA